MNQGPLARAHVGARDPQLEHEAAILDAGSQRMELVRRQRRRAVDDVEQHGLEVVEQRQAIASDPAFRADWR